VGEVSESEGVAAQCFDIWGRPITVPVRVSASETTQGPAWQVEVQIKDWAEFASIEYDT
jgi:hypothetical protein